MMADININTPTERDKLLLNELLVAVDTGVLNEETIGEFRYEHLRALLRYAVLLGEGADFYIQVKRYIESISVNKMRKKEKIRVAFIVSGIPVWCGDELYRLLDGNGRFEPYIYVFLHNIGQSAKLMLDEYDEHLKFFQEKGMRVVETINRVDGRIYTWEEIGGFPDVCIWTTPWIYAHFPQQCFTEYPLTSVHAYIPYGYMIANNEENDYAQMQYNYEFHNLIQRIYEEDIIALEMAQKYAFIGSENAVYAGALKMDKFYGEIEKDPWEEVYEKCGNKNAKKIIYAPHHSVHEGTILWSTFKFNHREMLELAKKYGEDTIWLFKPHPAMKFRCIYAGIFRDEKEWDEYVQEWRNLKNGMVYEGTEYMDFFKMSDAMILDSASFIMEYMHTGKPLLFMQRQEQRFNEFGERLLEMLYLTNGENIAGIDEFIRDVVLKEKDSKKIERDVFFATRKDAGEQSVARSIYEDICETFN